MTKTPAWYAESYIKNFGMHIVPIEPKRKFPRSANWGNNTISDATKAREYYDKHPDWNMGIVLGPSRMCSLDIDNLDAFSLICEAFGFDLDDLIKNTPTIVGNPKGCRLEFRVPADVNLPYVKLNWRPESDPTGAIYKDLLAQARDAKQEGNTELENELRESAKQHAPFTVFELRSATDGSQKQNVWPPSIHPVTEKPYYWKTQPRKDWPEPPPWLLTIWQEFEQFKPQLMAACPWSSADEIYKPKAKKSNSPQYNASGGFQRVVQVYNNTHSIDNSLIAYGYKRIGKRFLSPNSSTNIPGVVFFDDNRCWIHHASDALCSDETGQPVSPFDLFCSYDHGGDFKRAVLAAGESMGIRTDAPMANHAPPPYIDIDTGEVFDATVAPDHLASTVSVDTQSPLPWTTQQGKPLKHIDNLREICNRLGVTLRYNVISKEEELLIPGKSFSMDNQANASLAWLSSECSIFNFATDKLGEFITYLADQNQYNPVAQWIQSHEWDGIDRMRDIFATVTAVGEKITPEIRELKETLIKRWMISAVAAAFSPTGVAAAGVLVFQGAQYLGKTKWFKTLVPPELGLLKDGMLLRPDDKDSVKQVCSFWMVELGELDSTFRKADIAALKAFITNDSDVLRRPYARRESHFARRTVFFGSVNPSEFLHDTSGNRRYWTIACEHLDHSHTINMQQVWAQVYEMYRNGEGFYLTPDEMDMLNRSNEGFMAIDPVEERIMSRLDWSQPVEYWVWMQTTEILILAGVDRPTRADLSTAGVWLRKQPGVESRRSNGKTLLLVPPPESRSY